MKAQILQQIKEKFGSKATDSAFECGFYSRDLAPVPELLVNPLFNTHPDLVVCPADTQEVAEILKLAADAGIPVTPRAGASTVYFDSVPLKGGIVLDLHLLKGIAGLDVSKATVTVGAATTWSELERYLKPKGYAPKSFPSSAPVATVGGWFCMMGYGLGSIKYGSLVSQVKRLRVVLPTGEIKEVTQQSSPPVEWFAGTEGTLGVITELEVEVRPIRPMEHFLVQFPDVRSLAAAVSQLKDAALTPYNLHFADEEYIQAMIKLGFFSAAPGNVIQIDYEGTEQELKLAEDIVANICSAGNGKLLPKQLADLEWEENCLALRIKRGGPAVLGGEVWLPIAELAGYLADIRKMAAKYRLNLKSYGHVVSPENATVMTMFYADETRVGEYILNLSLVKKIHDIGYRHKGCPYGVGLWNTPYLHRIFPAQKLAQLRDRKQQLDSKGTMNPGKLYRPPLIMNPLCFGLAMELLAGIRRVVVRGEEK